MSPGEKWIRMVRSYGPVADDEARHAEQVDQMASRYGIPRISFPHPHRQPLLDCFPPDGNFANTVLTGTAGEGKTRLCFELVQHLTGTKERSTTGLEVIEVPTFGGPRKVTLIYDVSGWRKKQKTYLQPDQVELLHRMARSTYEGGSEFFVLAVNDGQLHALFRSLPPDAPAILRDFQRDLIQLHTSGSTAQARLRLLNLSRVPSAHLMHLCLTALLDRLEWSCLETERNNPLFAENSSLARNYRTLTIPAVRERLITLARIADVSGHHLPVRGLLCLLSNALLGHPDAKDRVLRSGSEAEELLAANQAQRAALHRTLFGDNLTPNARRKREVYRFLGMLHVGEETTNELDELIIFGSRVDELAAAHRELVLPDPHSQRNPNFPALVRSYIQGDLADGQDTEEFMNELAAERRRLFLNATPPQLQKFKLWSTTVFHHAQHYLDEILLPLKEGRRVHRQHLRPLAAGLNRVWTGLLLADNPHKLHLTTGLDLTTSPVSDISLAYANLDADPAGLDVCANENHSAPDLIIRTGGREFRFSLTLPRFEFLRRVAAGAMPSSFSREAFADFMALKQRCLRDLDLRASNQLLHLIDVSRDGEIHERTVYLE